MDVGGTASYLRLRREVQVAHPRRRRQRQQTPIIPHTIRNPTIPTAAQMMMLFIAHLVFSFRFVLRIPGRSSHPAKSACPPDSAHYALFHFHCLLEKQLNPLFAAVADVSILRGKAKAFNVKVPSMLKRSAIAVILGMSKDNVSRLEHSRASEKNLSQSPFVFVRQILYCKDRTDRLLMLVVRCGFHANEIRRRSSDDAVPARKTMGGKTGRRFKAERPRAVIDEIANCRTELRMPFRRYLKS